jgi:hypothetical protein
MMRTSPSEEPSMVKEKQTQRESKKAPASTKKEKRAAKAAKRSK